MRVFNYVFFRIVNEIDFVCVFTSFVVYCLSFHSGWSFWLGSLSRRLLGGRGLILGVAIGQLFEHDFELFEVDLAVAVDVDLGDDVRPHPLLLLNVVAQNRGDFLRLDRPTPVLVEQLERREHVGLAEQLDLVDGRGAPLAEIDLATPVNVGLVEDLVGAVVDLSLVKLRVQRAVGLEELRTLDQTVAVFIELVERVAQFLLLLLRRQVPRHEGQRRLLEFRLVLFNIFCRQSVTKKG